MSNFKIFTETNADLSLELMQKTNVHIIPLTFTIDGKEYKNTPDNIQLSEPLFYNKVRNGAMPTTSQINVDEFKQHAIPYLEKGMDILHIAFTSELSGTYNSCRIAAEELSEVYPDRRIVVLDSLCASLGEGLIVYYAAMEQQKGASLDEVIKYVEDNKLKVAHWFTVDDLNHLYRGGRLSKLSAVAGTLLGVKPILNVSNDGKLVPKDKVRGRAKSIDYLVDKVIQNAVNPKENILFVSHGDCIEECEYFVDKVKERINFKDVYMNYVGTTVGTHSGPGTLAVFFYADKRD